MQRLVTVFLLAAPVWCQFAEFATTDDGSQVYFTTPLVQRNTATTAHTEFRLFRIDGRTFELFAERGSLARTDYGSSNDGVSSVQVTGDGNSVALVLNNICPSQECSDSINRAEIRDVGARILGEADGVLLSRNGRWALTVRQVFSPSFSEEGALIDLATGASQAAPLPATIDRKFALASDGSILATVGRQIGVWKRGKLTPLPRVTGVVALLGMSDDAGTVLVSRITLPPGGPSPELVTPDLIALDLRAGNAKVVHSFDRPVVPALLGITNDGRGALVSIRGPSGTGSAMLVRTDTGKIATLDLPAGEFAVAGALSGFGNAALLGTSHGRILRFPLGAAGDVMPPEELLPVTPYLNADTMVAPGSRIVFGLPGPSDVDWRDRIRLNGFPLAVLSQTASEITAQVPWELPFGSAEVDIDYPSLSPLMQRDPMFVGHQAPRLAPPAPGAPGALWGHLIRGDFSGYVTEPPKAGDIVILYTTGLGRVQGPVKTGEPAPLDALRPAEMTIDCRFFPYPSEATALFAGLAPGYIGIYQVMFQLGPDTPDGVMPSGMECRSEGGGNFAIVSPVISPRPPTASLPAAASPPATPRR